MYISCKEGDCFVNAWTKLPPSSHQHTASCTAVILILLSEKTNFDKLYIVCISVVSFSHELHLAFKTLGGVWEVIFHVFSVWGLGGTCVRQVNSCTGAIVQLSAASLSDTCRCTWDAFLSGFAHVNCLYCLSKKKKKKGLIEKIIK